MPQANSNIIRLDKDLKSHCPANVIILCSDMNASYGRLGKLVALIYKAAAVTVVS